MQEDTKKLTIRKLTEREALRLMAYTDEEIDRLEAAVDDRGKRKFSKTAMYQFAGNSVVVDCFKCITEAILDDIEQESEPAPKRRGPVTLDMWGV